MLLGNGSDSGEVLQRFLTKTNITFVKSESLHKSTHHTIFNKKWLEMLKEKKMEFWHYTTERFFYLEDFMMQYKVCGLTTKEVLILSHRGGPTLTITKCNVIGIFECCTYGNGRYAVLQRR